MTAAWAPGPTCCRARDRPGHAAPLPPRPLPPMPTMSTSAPDFTQTPASAWATLHCPAHQKTMPPPPCSPVGGAAWHVVYGLRTGVRGVRGSRGGKSCLHHRGNSPAALPHACTCKRTTSHESNAMSCTQDLSTGHGFGSTKRTGLRRDAARIELLPRQWTLDTRPLATVRHARAVIHPPPHRAQAGPGSGADAGRTAPAHCCIAGARQSPGSASLCSCL